MEFLALDELEPLGLKLMIEEKRAHLGQPLPALLGLLKSQGLGGQEGGGLRQELRVLQVQGESSCQPFQMLLDLFLCQGQETRGRVGKASKL